MFNLEEFKKNKEKLFIKLDTVEERTEVCKRLVELGFYITTVLNKETHGKYLEKYDSKYQSLLIDVDTHIHPRDKRAHQDVKHISKEEVMTLQLDELKEREVYTLVTKNNYTRQFICNGVTETNILHSGCIYNKNNYVSKEKHILINIFDVKSIRKASTEEKEKLDNALGRTSTPTIETFDWNNYTPKKRLEGFPVEIVKKMCERQVEQGNKFNVEVFEINKYSGLCFGGFDWNKSIENHDFWCNIIVHKNFNSFFKKYPKKSNKETLPRYVELLSGWSDNNEFVGEIFDTEKDFQTQFKKFKGITPDWDWNFIFTNKMHKQYFKLSTKEEYENQFNEIIGHEIKADLNLIHGEYYWVKSNYSDCKYIFQYNKIQYARYARITTLSNSIDLTFKRLICISDFMPVKNIGSIRLATNEEIFQLQKSIEHNKFFEPACTVHSEPVKEPKISIPEFVKIIDNGKMFRTHPKAKKYGCVNYKHFKLLENNSICKVIDYIEINKGNWGYAVTYEGFDYLIGEEGVKEIFLVDDYIPGETYYTHIDGDGSSFYIFNMPLDKSDWYKIENTLGTNKYVHYIDDYYKEFGKRLLHFDNKWTDNIRLATPKEKEWLEICIRQNRYVYKHELPKYITKSDIIDKYGHEITEKDYILIKNDIAFISKDNNIVKTPPEQKIEFKINLITVKK